MEQYPVNVMNLNSVHKFQAEIPQDAELPQLDVLRFRPNIIRQCSFPCPLPSSAPAAQPN